eukprot:1145433-Pelagomonas_calceolata.AAC.2
MRIKRDGSKHKEGLISLGCPCATWRNQVAKTYVGQLAASIERRPVVCSQTSCDSQKQRGKTEAIRGCQPIAFKCSPCPLRRSRLPSTFSLFLACTGKLKKQIVQYLLTLPYLYW